MKKQLMTIGLLTGLFSLPAALHAEIVSIGPGGFTSSHSVTVEADAETVYTAITQIEKWWNPDHSWTLKAENLYLDARPGGCFCERLPDGGGVEHLRIIYLAPGKEIRFEGALGPLQGLPTSGRMIWKIEPADAGSTITFTFHVFGFMDGGFEGLAPAVDGVVAEQLKRLSELLS